MKSTRTRLLLEPLEGRIAPASVLSFTDIDGDRVRVNCSAGDITNAATFASSGLGKQLQVLDLRAIAFQGANISTTVTRAAGGDGLVNVGQINAAGRDLGTVTIQ